MKQIGCVALASVGHAAAAEPKLFLRCFWLCQRLDVQPAAPSQNATLKRDLHMHSPCRLCAILHEQRYCNNVVTVCTAALCSIWAGCLHPCRTLLSGSIVAHCCAQGLCSCIRLQATASLASTDSTGKRSTVMYLWSSGYSCSSATQDNKRVAQLSGGRLGDMCPEALAQTLGPKKGRVSGQYQVSSMSKHAGTSFPHAAAVV